MGRTYNFDVLMQLADGGAAVTASGIAKVGGSNKIIDLGGTGDVRTDLGIVGNNVSRGDFAAVINVTALTNTTDGHYLISIMGSNNANGSAAVCLGELNLGLGTTLPNGATGSELTGTGSDTAPGRREMMFTTEMNAVFYRYIYAYTSCLGTTGKSITWSGYVAKLPLT
jgi:hypothetical protein